MGVKNVSGLRKVFRGGKPRWFIDFRFTDKNGVRQRFRRDASVQNYAAALAEASRLMKRAAETGCVEDETQEPTVDRSTTTYANFVAGPFESLFMPRFRPATARRYRELHRQRVLGFFGSKPLGDIGATDFRAFAAQLHADRIQTKGPIALVRSVLRAAHESGYLDEIPVCPPGLVSGSRKLPTAPSSEEVDWMLRASGWLGTAIALAALAGMRMGEVRALEVRDVEFEQHCVVTRRALSEDKSLTRSLEPSEGSLSLDWSSGSARRRRTSCLALGWSSTRPGKHRVARKCYGGSRSTCATPALGSARFTRSATTSSRS